MILRIHFHLSQNISKFNAVKEVGNRNDIFMLILSKSYPIDVLHLRSMSQFRRM